MSRALRVLLAAALVSVLLPLLLPGNAGAEKPSCIPAICKELPPKPDSTPSPSATASPTSFALPTPTGGPTLPPTASAVPVKPPTPTPAASLPPGDAPQLVNASPSASGITDVATLPTGGAPDATKNPLGTVVLIAFFGLMALTAVSAWLFFKLR